MRRGARTEAAQGTPRHPFGLTCTRCSAIASPCAPTRTHTSLQKLPSVIISRAALVRGDSAAVGAAMAGKQENAQRCHVSLRCPERLPLGALAAESSLREQLQKACAGHAGVVSARADSHDTDPTS